jgi:hypothetical protein
MFISQLSLAGFDANVCKADRQLLVPFANSCLLLWGAEELFQSIPAKFRTDKALCARGFLGFGTGSLRYWQSWCLEGWSH